MPTKSKKKINIEVEKNEAPVEEEVPTMEEEDNKVTIEDLPGVGPATAEKLREAGFEELLALAVMSPGDLAEEAELGEAVSAKIIAAAKKMAITKKAPPPSISLPRRPIDLDRFLECFIIKSKA